VPPADPGRDRAILRGQVRDFAHPARRRAEGRIFATGTAGRLAGGSSQRGARTMNRSVVWGTLLLIALVAIVACNGAPEDASPEGAAPDQVARTYAPELGIQVDRMERRNGGLLVEDVQAGTGAMAEAGREVLVHYTGWLPDGTMFDSSHDHGQPFPVVIGQGRVIRGWDEGIPGMREGGVRRLVIPYGMAYGPSGMGPIPPRATLVFEVELLQVR
jgi:FKBP-type peptidyl-prolyl cis-trans isomerase FkpA